MNVCPPAAPSTSMMAPSESTVTIISVIDESGIDDCIELDDVMTGASPWTTGDIRTGEDLE